MPLLAVLTLACFTPLFAFVSIALSITLDARSTGVEDFEEENS